MFYKIYVTFKHNSILVMDRYFRDKQAFFAFIGGFYLGSTRRIECIDYEMFDKETVKNVDFIINRSMYI